MGLRKIQLLFTTGGAVLHGQALRDAAKRIPVKIHGKKEQLSAILRIQKDHGTRLQVKENLNPEINARYVIHCMMEKHSHREV